MEKSTVEVLSERLIEMNLLHMGLRYRVDLLEQVVLRLLADVATQRPDAATQLHDQVLRRAKKQMDRRQNPVEMEAQKSMLELLNNVRAAASPPTVWDDDGA